MTDLIFLGNGSFVVAELFSSGEPTISVLASKLIPNPIEPFSSTDPTPKLPTERRVTLRRIKMQTSPGFYMPNLWMVVG